MTTATKSLDAEADAAGSAPVGLTTEEAARRRALYGPNDVASGKPRHPVAEFLLLLTEPLTAILVVAAVVAGFVGQAVDATILLVMVFLGTVIDFVQTRRSTVAMEGLRKSVSTTATVLRDGTWSELPRDGVVPGDIVRLSAGDLVPADARLVDTMHLFVLQAALTGESMPVSKDAEESGGDDPSAPNLVFLGTSVVSGSGMAEVLRTGADTSFGHIAKQLRARPQETEFQRGLRQFGLLILRAVIFLVLFVLVVNLALHRAGLESLLFAVALAIGLTPEFLPVVTAVTLSKGALRMAQAKVIVKHLGAIQNFGSIDILCSDKTGTLTLGEMTLESAVNGRGEPDARVLELAALNSRFETGIRSPLDRAILDRSPAQDGRYRKCYEIPFDFERRRLSVVVESAGVRTLIVKGAPESVLPLCAMDAAGMFTARGVVQRQSQAGRRVLAVAFRAVPARERYFIHDEANLELAGFLAFADPPLPDAAEALEGLKRDGVVVKILTGDSEAVAGEICRQVGMAVGEVVTGGEIDRMTDAALGHVAENTTLFARLTPAQKTRVIVALKQRGHVVGYLGDGINDAPSLRHADVGISVASAVDVAREAADIVLLEPSLRVIHTGIVEGRRAFGNVMKYLLMGTSSNFGNMVSMAAAAVFLPFLPMLPTQILLNNFLYDLAQVTIPSDRVDESFIAKPHKWDVGLIRDFMLLIGPISSLYDFLTFYVLLHLFHASEELFHTGWFVESLATQTLVLFVIRTMGNPLRSRPSMALTVTTLAIVAVAFVLPYSPLAGPLGFQVLPASYVAFVLAAASTYLLLVEFVKRKVAARLG